MNARERVMAVISHKKPDRIPCFSANSTITFDQMEKVGAYWPEGHMKAEAMAKQALAAHALIGFDAVKVPFCQTIEAEALGCKIKPGGTENMPAIDHHPYNLDEMPEFPDDYLHRGRIPELLQAVRTLKEQVGDEVAVIGGITGPLSITVGLVEPTTFLKATLKAPDKIRPFLEVSEKAGTILANALIDAGADIIACEDMASSPGFIHPKTYGDFERGFQARQFQAIPVPKILHICGKVDRILGWMGETGANILSLEPKTSPQLARQKCGPITILMGGMDTNTLLCQDSAVVKQASQESIANGIQILAPGCAVGPHTPLENLSAMVEVAKRFRVPV